MALAIATNNAALNAAASASSVNRDMETSMARLSSGKRINSASDDAAGVAISSRLSAEIRGTDQAIRNALDGQALIDTAEGAHSEIENILQRMREVSVQAANDTNNDQDRANLQAEMSALVTEIDRIAGTTTWAGEKLMEAESGTKFSFQVGAKTSAKNQIAININGMGAHALGLQADSTDVQRTLSEVTVGQSINTVDYNPALQIRQGSITSGVVTANNGNTSITLPKLGATGTATDVSPVISQTATANDTITLNADALAAGFTLTLESGVSVTAVAGETTAQLAAAINAGTGTTAATTSPASNNGHGYSAVAAGNVITLTAAGAITGGVGPDSAGTGTSTAAGSGTMTGVATTSVSAPGAPYTLSDVAYDSTDPASINAAVASINAGTVATNITATVGADGSDNAGKLILGHSGSATGIGTHADVTALVTAYDTANSDMGATVAINAAGTEGTIDFLAGAGTISLTLAQVTSTGAAVSVSIDTTADLQTAVDAINDGSGAANSGNGTALHGYTAEIVASSGDEGTIKLIKADPGAGHTQTSLSDLDFSAVGRASQVETSADGSFALVAATETVAAHGVFTPGSLNTTGTINLTLGGTEVVVEGISNRGASSNADVDAIVAEINSGAHGYKAEVMKNADNTYTGNVKISQPVLEQNMNVTTGDRARESIVAIDAAIQTVNIQRSSLGAVSNRLSHTINNLTNISSNLSAAQGGIEDADFAHETTMLAKNQILQQASTAMLAQANASKQNVLSLLQG